MKYINADKLKERLDDQFHEEVSIEYIKSLIDELSEEREEGNKLNEADYLKKRFKEKVNEYDYFINKGRVEAIIDEIAKELQQPNPLKVAIKGDGTEEYGRKIIEYFKDDAIPTACTGKSKLYYYIDETNKIFNSPTLPEGYTEISLKEEEKVVTDNSKVNTYLLNRVEELEKELIDLKLKLKDLSK